MNVLSTTKPVCVYPSGSPEERHTHTGLHSSGHTHAGLHTVQFPYCQIMKLTKSVHTCLSPDPYGTRWHSQESNHNSVWPFRACLIAAQTFQWFKDQVCTCLTIVMRRTASPKRHEDHSHLVQQCFRTTELS